MIELTSGYLFSVIGVVILALVGFAFTNFGKARWWRSFVRHSDRWACLFLGMVMMVLLQSVFLHQFATPLLLIPILLLCVVAIACANSEQRRAMIVAETQATGYQHFPDPTRHDHEDEGNDVATLAAGAASTTLPASAYRSPTEPLAFIGPSQPKRHRHHAAASLTETLPRTSLLNEETASVHPLKAFRISRLPYWLIAAPLIAACFYTASDMPIAIMAYAILCGLTWARLNDAAESIWYMVCMITGLLAPLVILYCLFAPSREPKLRRSRSASSYAHST